MCCPIKPTDYIDVVVQQSHASPWRGDSTVTPSSDTVSTVLGARCYKPELGQFFLFKGHFLMLVLPSKKLL